MEPNRIIMWPSVWYEEFSWKPHATSFELRVKQLPDWIAPPGPARQVDESNQAGLGW